MDITPLVRADTQIIQSYRGGRFAVNGQIFETSIFIYCDLTQVWPVQDIISLTAEDFQPAIAAGIEILLFGTGERAQMINPAVRTALRDQGMTVDVMDTGAACRTYNVLVAEGRAVGAVLLPHKES